MTHGKVWINSSEDAGAITSTTDHWLRKRFSPELMAMVGCTVDHDLNTEDPHFTTPPLVERRVAKQPAKSVSDLVLTA